MSITLSNNSYGKSGIRVLKVVRTESAQLISEISVDVQLTGQFGDAYENADNSRVIPTDTMKNTVYLLARQQDFDCIERFAIILASHFRDEYSQVSESMISISETGWRRIRLSGKGEATAHPFSFTHGGNERQTTSVTANNKAISIQSGIKNLQILKSTDSGFENYNQDRYTTLKPTHDRVLSTNMTARWKYAGSDPDFISERQVIRCSLLEKFSNHYSHSVQETLHLMGSAALDACRKIDEIYLSMPNKHYLLVDLAPLGEENQNEIFVPTDEPYGMIEGTLQRG